MAKTKGGKARAAAATQAKGKKAAPGKPAPKKPTAAKKAGAAKEGPKKASAARKRVSLPRPKITSEELLFLLFKDDYHARQIFDFLRVKTVGELEQFSPREIVERLSRPVTESVERIRQKLAEKNRYLAGDVDFLLAHKEAERDSP
jgi:hypothetical protein